MGPRVNTPANDDAECVAPLARGAPPGEQFELWPRALLGDDEHR